MEIVEALGYLGRVLMHHDPFDKVKIKDYMPIQESVVIFGSDISRIPPGRYTRIFIPCDIISLLIQIGGFMILNNAIRKDTSTKLGNNIVIAGISFQVLALTLFISLTAEYFWRVRQRGSSALNPACAKFRNSTRFTFTLTALILATLCIYARSAYRLAEFAEGWLAAPNRNQKLYIGLESVLVTIAMLALNAFHPGVCFRDEYRDEVEGEKNSSSDSISA
ncbi:hypothetical protein FGG08_005664 [Glutinoglossum americanum]|uniref:Uncharacterized protein n=1 Tax=Glutinoglossum americanum TaxID=1670608 RepID=A0A9P8HY10_9PEZI|nr:hypothetical protein FGG08_005664 [Glutinoglossum americanum]